MNVELPCACPKLKLNSGILFTSFKKRHLQQKAQEPIKKVISQYRCCVPNHPKGRRQLCSHYIALRLPPGWFSIDTAMDRPLPLASWAYWGFVKNCQSTPGCLSLLGLWSKVGDDLRSLRKVGSALVLGTGEDSKSQVWFKEEVRSWGLIQRLSLLHL